MHITKKKINLLSLYFFSIIYLMWAHEGQRGIKKGAYIKRSKMLECSINWTFMYNTVEKVRIPPNSLNNWKAQLHQSFLINTSRVASLTKSKSTKNYLHGILVILHQLTFLLIRIYNCFFGCHNSDNFCNCWPRLLK